MASFKEWSRQGYRLPAPKRTIALSNSEKPLRNYSENTTAVLLPIRLENNSTRKMNTDYWFRQGRKSEARNQRLLKEEHRSSAQQATGEIEGFLRPAGKAILGFIKELRGCLDKRWQFRNACQRFKEWCRKNKLDCTIDSYKRLRESIGLYKGESFDDALGYDWNAILALFWFLKRQCYVTPELECLVEWLQKLLMITYETKEELDVRLHKMEKLMTSTKRHIVERMAVENGFSASVTDIFLPRYKYWMEGILCTSQCFSGNKCGLCLGCTAYREWYVANAGESIIGAPAPNYPPPTSQPNPFVQDALKAAQRFAGPAVRNGGTALSDIWAPRK